MTTPTPPRVTPDDMEPQAREVAALIGVWFSERKVWLYDELVLRAQADHVRIEAWYRHPIVEATGLRGVGGMLHDGCSAEFFILWKPEESD